MRHRSLVVLLLAATMLALAASTGGLARILRYDDKPVVPRTGAVR